MSEKGYFEQSTENIDIKIGLEDSKEKELLIRRSLIVMELLNKASECLNDVSIKSNPHIQDLIKLKANSIYSLHNDFNNLILELEE